MVIWVHRGAVDLFQSSTSVVYLLLTCLSVSDPNNARLESFQSYCFCFVKPKRITHLLKYCKTVVYVKDLWEVKLKL